MEEKKPDLSVRELIDRIRSSYPPKVYQISEQEIQLESTNYPQVLKVPLEYAFFCTPEGEPTSGTIDIIDVQVSKNPDEGAVFKTPDETQTHADFSVLAARGFELRGGDACTINTGRRVLYQTGWRTVFDGELNPEFESKGIVLDEILQDRYDGYHGILKVRLINESKTSVEFKKGDLILDFWGVSMEYFF